MLQFERLSAQFSWGICRAGLGVFGTIDEAMKAAAIAQRALVALGLETRKRIISEIRASSVIATFRRWPTTRCGDRS